MADAGDLKSPVPKGRAGSSPAAPSTRNAALSGQGKIAGTPRGDSSWIALFLLAAVVAAGVAFAHWPALSSQALTFDDNQYFTDNYFIHQPSWTSAKRFLTEVMRPSTVMGYYQPLTMISLMLDVAAGGSVNDLRPFHRTSLVLHVANCLLIFLILYRLFGRAVPAATAALLFGVHPLTVEPIPWVGERKTLLAAFFSLAAILVYLRYAQKRGPFSYAGVVILYVLALMSKPTSTPLPVMLLLLDCWPLRRFDRRAIMEKIPLLVIAGISAVITYYSQAQTAGATLPTSDPLRQGPLRICHNIIFYLWKLIWPADLCAHYSIPKPFNLSDPMLLAGLVGTLILIPLLLYSLRWTRAALVGWLIYFVALSPTLQVISFSESMASDKYVYLPLFGIVLALGALLSWFWDQSARSQKGRIALIGSVLALAVAESVGTRRYLRVWRDTPTFYEYVIRHAPNEAALYSNLGVRLFELGRIDEAIDNYRKALAIDPQIYEARNNLGRAYLAQGRTGDAEKEMIATQREFPGDYIANYNLGMFLAQHGRNEDALPFLKIALEIRPDHPAVLSNTAAVLMQTGRFAEAEPLLRRVTEMLPDMTIIRYNLATALRRQGKLDEARFMYEEVLRRAPQNAESHFYLAQTLESQGQMEPALHHYRECLRLEPTSSRAEECRQKLGIASQPSNATTHATQPAD